MTDSSHESGSRQHSIGQPSPGDRICICRGSLAGATGEVVRWKDEQTCILKLDGVTDGVFVVIAGSAVERTHMPT